MSKIDEISADLTVKKHLEKLLEKTPHCLLFEGPKGSGKEALADAFARQLLKTTKKDPPDLCHLYPEGKGNNHPIDSMRRFIQETALHPFEAERKVFIIHEADRMLPTSSNALLRTLEEPVSAVTIILITAHPELLLPTVISRSFRIPFLQLKPEENKELAEQMFHIGLCLLQKDLPLSKDLPDIANPEQALYYLFAFYRDLHLVQAKGDPTLLHFKEKQEILSSIKPPAPPLGLIQSKIERLLEASTLQLPLSHTLIELL